MGDFKEPQTIEGWRKSYNDLMESSTGDVLIYNLTIESYHQEIHPSGKGGPCVICRMKKEIGDRLRKGTE